MKINVRKSCWEGLITHNKKGVGVGGLGWISKRKEGSSPIRFAERMYTGMYPLKRDCLSCSFFLPSVAFCPGGLQVLWRAQYPHIHILILFWCQSPVPMDNTCSDSPLSPTQCLLFWLMHSHPSPHRQSLSEPCWGETAFSLKPPPPPLSNSVPICSSKHQWMWHNTPEENCNRLCS